MSSDNQGTTNDGEEVIEVNLQGNTDISTSPDQRETEETQAATSTPSTPRHVHFPEGQTSPPGRGRGRGRGHFVTRGNPLPGRGTRTAGLYSPATRVREPEFDTIVERNATNTATRKPPPYMNSSLQAISVNLDNIPDFSRPIATTPQEAATDEDSDTDINTEDTQEFTQETPTTPGTSQDSTASAIKFQVLQLDTYTIPDGYAYVAEKNVDATEEDKSMLNREANLDKATETLIPRKHLTDQVYKLRKTMHDASLQYNKAIASYNYFVGKPDIPRKCVKLKPTFIKPNGLEAYPSTLKPMFDKLTDDFDTFTASYKRGASAIIHKGQQITCFKNRLDRVRLLSSQLIHEFGVAHIEFYKVKYQEDVMQPFRPSVDPTQEATKLAILAVHNLWTRIDLSMLEYLDINRDKLIEVFDECYKPADTNTLSAHDKEAIKFAADTILSYIKPATCLYSQEKMTVATESSVEKTLATTLAARATKRATAAVAAAIDQADVPKDYPTLHKIIQTVIKSSVKPDKVQNPKLKTTDGNKKQKSKANKKDNKGGKKQTPAKGKKTKAKHPGPTPKGKGAQKNKPAGNPKTGNKQQTNKQTGKQNAAGTKKQTTQTKGNKQKQKNKNTHGGKGKNAHKQTKGKKHKN
jgi:hypothetical protein